MTAVNLILEAIVTKVLALMNNKYKSPQLQSFAGFELLLI